MSWVKEDDGFALIAALLAVLLLMVIGILTFTVTTRDIRISTRIMGEKKGFSAAETGVNTLMQQVQNADPIATIALPLGDPPGTVVTLAADPTDPDSTYSYQPPPQPGSASAGTAFLPLAGYAIGGGQQWGQEICNLDVTGSNARYGSSVTLNIGIGYGPVEMTTMYR